MNVVIFGATQCGKSTLAGYIASSTRGDAEFNQAVLRNKRYIEDMEIGGFKDEMAYVSFVSMDRDELRRSAHQDTIGTTKRIHRKRIIAKGNGCEQAQKLILIDTPGVRSCAEGRYTGIFEGDVGICLLSAADLMGYAEGVRSHWEGCDPRKKFHFEKRLFDAIRFWCIYKGSDNLVIAISKVDMLNYDPDWIQDLSDLVSGVLKGYGIKTIPIVPIAVCLNGAPGNYVRGEYNVFSSDEEDKALMPLAFKRVRAIKAANQEGTEGSTVARNIFASVNRLCKIKNGPGYALRVKILAGTVFHNSALIIGPVRTKTDETVLLSGSIKSLKEEGDEKTSGQLTTGTIGGIAFSDLYADEDARSLSAFPKTRAQDITQFRILKTTILTNSAVKMGDIIELTVADEELNESARLAIEAILPKDTIQFLWFGKKLSGHVVSLYQEHGRWHMSLYNVDPDYRKANGPFMVPVANERGVLDIECPVILQLPRWYSEHETQRSLTTFVDFSLKNLHAVDWTADYMLKVVIEDECVYQQEELESILEMSVKLEIERGFYVIEKSFATEQNLGNVLRILRKFIRDEGICKYALYFEESHN